MSGCIGAGMECKGSGASRGIRNIRGHWGAPMGMGPSGGVGGVRGALGLAGSVKAQRPARVKGA